MRKDIEKMSLQQKIEHLFTIISGQRFLQKKGLGNEVPFFIFPYKAGEAVAMERQQRQLISRLEQAGIQILEINLYDLSINILKERNIWDKILDVEENVSKDELKELLQDVLDSETHLKPVIASLLKSRDYDVLFISGVGEVFPYIRAHNVLNNLQSIAKDKPTVMFFPGAYTHSLETGAKLVLFGKLTDDKYYRAFNILDYES